MLPPGEAMDDIRPRQAPPPDLYTKNWRPEAATPGLHNHRELTERNAP